MNYASETYFSVFFDNWNDLEVWDRHEDYPNIWVDVEKMCVHFRISIEDLQ